MAHPLDGARAKIQRAEEQVKNLKRDTAAFLSHEPALYQVVGQHQGDGLEYAFVVSGEPNIPPRFAIMAGEIVHQLRSSLDHLLYALVVRNRGTPTGQHRFPVCSSAEQFEQACRRGCIEGISASAAKLVRAAQPYASSAPEDTILRVVDEFDALDRQQLLVVVIAVARLGQAIRIKAHRKGKAPVIVGSSDPASRQVTKAGAVVFTIRFAEPAPDFQASADFVPQIAFEKCGRVPLVPVVVGLSNMVSGIKNTLEGFAGEFG